MEKSLCVLRIIGILFKLFFYYLVWRAVIVDKQLTDAKLGEVLKYLKQPEYGCSCLIVERPCGLEGLQGEIQLLLSRREQSITLDQADILCGGGIKTNFLSFWQATEHLKEKKTQRIPVIGEDRAKFKAQATGIVRDFLYPEFDRDDVMQAYIFIARLRKNRTGQDNLYELLCEKLSSLSDSSIVLI